MNRVKNPLSIFLNLEKKNSINNTIRKICINNGGNNETECVDDEAILNHVKTFYEQLFDRKSSKTYSDCTNFLNGITTPLISSEEKSMCDKELCLQDLSDSLNSMTSGKSPGNDGLTIEFYKHFWTHIKDPLLNSALYSKSHGSLSVSQKQAIIKLLEKKEKDKRYVENWRPISLLNVDTKIISKAFANRLKCILPNIISHDQTAYVKGRFIGESTRLISDILEVTDSYDISGYILTADIEKAFDSMDHTFLIATLDKFGFGRYFIDWIKVLLNDNESCVINGGKTSRYFKLKRGARQGDPIAAYLFILSLEIYFIMLRANKDIKKLNIFNHDFLLSAYADDTTFFVQDISSINIIFDIFHVFSNFSGFKLNLSKCELGGIGALKGVKTALCNIKNIDLTNNFMKILGIHFSYNIEIFTDKNFISVIKKMENVLKVWKMRLLTLNGKIVIFKSLAISKIVYISSISSMPQCILNEVKSIHKAFIWDNKRPKIKHSTLISDHCDGGLRDVDIDIKIKALHLSWLKRLFDNNFHPWKNIPQYLFSRFSPTSSVFFPNFVIENYFTMSKFPLFYQELMKNWSEISQSTPLTASSIMSESIWYNSCLKIGNTIISPIIFRNKIKNLFIADFFDHSGIVLSWNEFKLSKNIDDSLYFQWLQISNTIPNEWKRIICEDRGNSRLFCEFSSHLIIKAKIFPVDKLTSKMLYSIVVKARAEPPTSQRMFLSLFKINSLPWKKIYTLPNRISIDSYSRVFQYKILNNILYLNNKLHKIGFSDTPLCSYCNQHNETINHLFVECRVSKTLWNDIKSYFQDIITIPDLDLQSAVLGFFNDDGDLALNNILLIFKLCLYRFRNKKTPNFQLFLKNLYDRESLERNIVMSNATKLAFHNKKWLFLTSMVH